jgi:NADH:ubiquinone oxidoreductase subunit 5 (subunit L)/multisubunit Na+/H+ antiporter MnhA subunit
MNWNISLIINFLWLIPFIAFVSLLPFQSKNEKRILFFVNLFSALNFLMIFFLTVLWLSLGFKPLNFQKIALYHSEHYAFVIDFLLDFKSLTFLWMGSLLFLLITRYSSIYMHREPGFKRFFVTLSAFLFGYNFLVIAGNFETLYIGWEILGISSFFLIAFYRDRYLPVNNANFVFSVYRLGDLGILLAMWGSHHLWNENITFFKLFDKELVTKTIEANQNLSIFIGIMLLLAASVKSAQVPFSYWLPRAMEGPTPSSAIFYGALSIHMGVFLLLRTAPLWEHQTFTKILIALIGIITSLLGYFTARVQSNVKSQIAYASIAQIGLMFIEIAFGLHYLVLIHFIGNAFLRTYQLLITPSVVNYLIREQFYYFEKSTLSFQHPLLERLHFTLFWLSLKEWFLEQFIRTMIFYPAKFIGRFFYFINLKISTLLTILISLFIGIFYYFKPYFAYFTISNEIMMSLLLTLGFLAVLKSFSEKKDPILAFSNIFYAHLLTAYSALFHENFNIQELLIYLSGHIGAYFLGLITLFLLKRKEPNFFHLSENLGHSYEHPRQNILFFIAIIIMTGLPLSPSFIGEDLIFSYIHHHQIYLALMSSLNFVFTGIALIRIYSLLFLGPHAKRYHELPYRYS